MLLICIGRGPTDATPMKVRRGCFDMENVPVMTTLKEIVSFEGKV